MKPEKLIPKIHTISWLVQHKGEFKVDRNYQRELVWPLRMKQYLIDTILRGLDIGRIFVRVQEDKYFIVDGQQRLNAIWEFAENKYPLGDYSRPLGLSGKFYNDLPREIREDSFDEYNVNMVYLLNVEDEEVRDIYRRINSGIPLNTAERLNAYPGNIVLTVRELANDYFLQEICGLKKRKRFRALHIAAQMLLLQKKGIHDIAPRSLFEFFEKNKDLDDKSSDYRKIVRVFNFLKRAFDKPTPELRKPSWIITTYLLASYLLDNYVMTDREKEFARFITDFYHKVLESSKTGDEELINFNLAISRGTTSKENIDFRHKIILSRFLEHIGNLVPLDPKRNFTEEEKIAILRRQNYKCAICGVDLRGKPYHVHHIIPWSEGGKTTVDNGQALCTKCHLELHKTKANH